MKKTIGSILTAALVVAMAAAGVTTASAAPPTAPWSGSAGGDIANLTTTAVGLNLAGARLAVADTAAGSTQTPRARATSSNLGATVAGLPVTVASAEQVAPPDAGGPVTSPVVGLSVPTLLSLGALTTTNDANWTVDTACVTNGVLASSSTQTAGLSVLPLVGGGAVELGVSQTTGQTALVQNTGLNHGVRSTATGTISGLSILGGLVGVGVAGTTTLTATATGTGPATVEYSPATVTVTAAGSTTTLTAAQPTRSVNLVGLGTVSVTLNTPTTSTTATSATATSTLVTVAISLPLLGTSVTLGVLPLRAAATAPAGGIDCPPPPPVITSPVNGASTGATPPISGTALPGASVNVLVDGVSVGTTTANGAGNWSLTPATPLTPGAHTATAVQTVAGTPSPASAGVTFTVDTTPPPPPVITAPADGSQQTSRQPAIVGTAEANSTVTVTIDGAVAGTAPVDGAGAWTFTPATPLADGAHSASARATDAAGNVSPVSNTITFTIDATAPPAPVITAPANGSSTTDTTPAFTGTAEPNTTVTVLVDGTAIGTAPAGGDGAWTFTPTTALAAGPRVATATATDAAGNVSPASAPVAFTIDTTAPPAPVITAPADGSVVATATPAIAGTAEPNTTVAVTIDGVVAGTTPADGTGAWTFTPGTPLAAGGHTASATATDAAGNVGPASATTAFTVDTTAPAAPVITSPADGAVTNDTTPAIFGTAEADSTVNVSIDGAPAGVTNADSSGDWTFTPTTPLAPGVHTTSATATDAAGNVSPPSAVVSFTVDTTAPAAPVITSPLDGSTIADTTPTITGTAEANSTVAVSIDGAFVATTPADAGGAWSYTPADPLTETLHTVSATATDAAGNTGPASATVSFTIDAVAPDAPVITSPVTGSTTADPTPDISGTAEPNTTVTVLSDGTAIGTAPVDGAGEWTLTPAAPLDNGPHTLTAVATDDAGNESPASAPVEITVDTGLPDAPVITSPTAGEALTDTTPDIVGTAEPDSTVTVTIDGVVVGTTPASGTGAWTFTSGVLAEGPHTVSATATDGGGNESPANPPIPFTIDTIAPAAPVITAPAGGSTVADPTPPISGTAEADSTVTVTIDGTEAGTTMADDTGAWTFTPPTALDDGEHTVSATATDAAGNTGPASAPVTFSVDTVDPAAPVITEPVDGSSTADPTPPVSGSAEADSTVTVTIDGLVVGTTPADGTGAWTFTPTTALVDGSHTVTATATDAGGNTGPASAPVDFTVDTAAPPAPVITAPANGSTTPDATPTISGTAEADATVSVTIDGAPAGTTAADATGAWSLVSPALGNGSHTATATATDPAGNTGPASAPTTFTVDTLPPAPPVITAPVDGAAVSTPTPVVTGTAEADASVLVTIDGTVAGTTAADGTGAWTFTPTTPLADGPHTVYATATDAAGNTSAPSATVGFTVDTAAPPAPVITNPADGSVTSDSTPAIFGTAEANATVTVTVDGAPAGTAIADGSGDWVLTPPPLLADGPHTASATATDAAGNVSAPSATVAFTVDTVIPAAPVIVTPADGSTSTSRTPSITGTAEADTTVTVTIDGAIVGTTDADGSGGWLFQPTAPLADGPHTTSATSTDAAGNVSEPSATITFAVDATAPPAPVVTEPADGSSTTDTTPTIQGTAEPNTTVAVLIDGVAVGSTAADGTGAWSFTPTTPLAEGTHTVSATATDSAGNTGQRSAVVTFEVDTLAPAPPVITSPEDGATTTARPAVGGTAEAGSTVTVSIDGVVAGETIADEDGAWTFTPTTALAEGDHSTSATATDAAGNASGPSNVVDFVVDAVPPGAPVITSPTSGSTLTDPQPPITGTAEPGSTVTVIVDGQPIGTVVVDPDGTWTFTPPSPLGEGPHTITATATDPAGNVGPLSAAVQVTIAGAPDAGGGQIAQTGGGLALPALGLGIALLAFGVALFAGRRRNEEAEERQDSAHH